MEKFDELLLAGGPTLEPRLAQLPLRLPLPPAEYQGSIYENRRAASRRFFETAAEHQRLATAEQKPFADRLVGAGPGLGWT